MSNVTDERITTIYKSRKNILDILGTNLGFDTSDYLSFSKNEISSMLSTSRLDMHMTNKTTGQRVYVRYSLMKPPNLGDIIEDLFYIENMLSKNDILIIIVEDEPNDTTTAKMKYLYDEDGIFIVMHNIKRLQFNILKSVYVPKHEVLTKQEIELMKKKYNVVNTVLQLPEISRFDPVALVLCVRPGDVVKITSFSQTAGFYEKYRVCV